MGRRPGSKNKPKVKPNEASHEPVAEVTPSPEAEVETGDGVAGGDAQEAAEPEQEVDDNAPPCMPLQERTIDEIGHDLSDTHQKLLTEESEKKRINEDYATKIGILKARRDELFAQYAAAEFPRSFNYSKGDIYVWDGRTGLLLRTEHMDPGTQLELPVKRGKKQEPEQDLAIGSRWFWSGSGLTGTITASDDAGFCVEYLPAADGTPYDPSKLVREDFAEAVAVVDTTTDEAALDA